ncbi:MAG: hypothetical protein ACI88L_000701 [Candidatus Paceibacteria bacterium]|jgi:hypothetical protein
MDKIFELITENFGWIMLTIFVVLLIVFKNKTKDVHQKGPRGNSSGNGTSFGDKALSAFDSFFANKQVQWVVSRVLFFGLLIWLVTFNIKSVMDEHPTETAETRSGAVVAKYKTIMVGPTAHTYNLSVPSGYGASFTDFEKWKNTRLKIYLPGGGHVIKEAGETVDLTASDVRIVTMDGSTTSFEIRFNPL